MVPRLLVFLVSLGVRALRVLCRPKAELVIENLALRQQIATLVRARTRPAIDDAERAFWVTLRASWAGWASRLFIVQADTVARWHRERFRRHWARISREKRRPGRPRIEVELRQPIRDMAGNGWGAPRIHGELRMLGCAVCEATVSRYMPRRPADRDHVKRWIAFLHNHKEAIAAMDFFTVPTISLRVLYGFLVIEHGRRHGLHFNVTFNPTAAWEMQQLREAFPCDTAPRHLLFDRDAIFSPAVVRFVKAMGTKPRRISYRSPWQNAVAERSFGSCRRELLEHVVVLDQRHLIRLVHRYLTYYHDDRVHLGLNKDTPNKRPVTPRPSATATVVALPRVGGLHHRYEWREAA